MTTRDDRPADAPGEGTPRRAVLCSAGLIGGLTVVAALAGCGGSSAADAAGSTGASVTHGGSAGGAAESVATSKVPVGSGIIDDNLQTVITQPTSGEFKAFNYLCTHQQCPVSQIQGEKIMCACHGSEFSIKDGSVLQGPATKPLEAKTATVKGSRVVIS
ncbi:Rieske (2Fe-2S) protein [Flexivirga oryzae]|uniref:Cytochrome bc1 complex Rieske iron-sulfur subunit n=1 Tax=Flexivirga oryzae TaxID=1794944 RepID=A0A839N239_9MICO|nr:Rieske (2Fe-2S) protein [Flexivirga oryzae]MBB2891417.1 Rieske Fe-S protein [Flexivirga oryzae]